MPSINGERKITQSRTAVAGVAEMYLAKEMLQNLYSVP